MRTTPLLIGMALLLVGNNVDLSAQDDGSLVYTSANIALEGIKEAEIAGADVSSLVKKFNYALSLSEQAKASDFRTCGSHDECIDKATAIFVLISHDSQLLNEQAHAALSHQRMMNFALYAPLGAFSATFLCLFSYRTWKSSHMKKFLNMEIKVIEN